MSYLYAIASGTLAEGFRLNGPFNTLPEALRYGREVIGETSPRWEVAKIYTVSPPSEDLQRIRSALDLLLTAADIVDLAGWSSDETRRRKAIGALADAAEAARDMLRETRRPACRDCGRTDCGYPSNPEVK